MLQDMKLLRDSSHAFEASFKAILPKGHVQSTVQFQAGPRTRLGQCHPAEAVDRLILAFQATHWLKGTLSGLFRYLSIIGKQFFRNR